MKKPWDYLWKYPKEQLDERVLQLYLAVEIRQICTEKLTDKEKMLFYEGVKHEKYWIGSGCIISSASHIKDPLLYFTEAYVAQTMKGAEFARLYK